MCFVLFPFPFSCWFRLLYFRVGGLEGLSARKHATKAGSGRRAATRAPRPLIPPLPCAPISPVSPVSVLSFSLSLVLARSFAAAADGGGYPPITQKAPAPAPAAYCYCPYDTTTLWPDIYGANKKGSRRARPLSASSAHTRNTRTLSTCTLPALPLVLCPFQNRQTPLPSSPHLPHF